MLQFKIELILFSQTKYLHEFYMIFIFLQKDAKVLIKKEVLNCLLKMKY